MKNTLKIWLFVTVVLMLTIFFYNLKQAVGVEVTASVPLTTDNCVSTCVASCNK